MTKTERTARLNDLFRSTFIGGRVLITPGIQAMSDEDRSAVVEKVQTFSAFTSDNDPHREHDFGAFEQGGQKVFWKIDYYDPALQFGSEDPSDPAKTARVLTVMLASEY